MNSPTGKPKNLASPDIDAEPEDGVFAISKSVRGRRPDLTANYHTLKSGMIDYSEGKIEFKIEEEI
jgi:hypothetical protein